MKKKVKNKNSILVKYINLLKVLIFCLFTTVVFLKVEANQQKTEVIRILGFPIKTDEEKRDENIRSYTEKQCLTNSQSSFLFNFDKCKHILCKDSEHAKDVKCFEYNKDVCVYNGGNKPNHFDNPICTKFRALYCPNNRWDGFCLLNQTNEETFKKNLKCDVIIDDVCILEKSNDTPWTCVMNICFGTKKAKNYKAVTKDLKKKDSVCYQASIEGQKWYNQQAKKCSKEQLENNRCYGSFEDNLSQPINLMPPCPYTREQSYLWYQQ